VGPDSSRIGEGEVVSECFPSTEFVCLFFCVLSGFLILGRFSTSGFSSARGSEKLLNRQEALLTAALLKLLVEKRPYMSCCSAQATENSEISVEAECILVRILFQPDRLFKR
jgi:hypothetical protein